MHLRVHPATPADWRDDALAAKWDKVREIRRVVTGALELARADKKIGASLQAHPVVHLTPERRAMLDGVDLSEISITSGITVSDAPAANGAFTLADVPGVAVPVAPADGEQVRALLAGAARGRQRTPITRRCAIAAPTWSRAWRRGACRLATPKLFSAMCGLAALACLLDQVSKLLVFRVLMVTTPEIG